MAERQAGNRKEPAMLELTALAVSAVATTCKGRRLEAEDAVEVTWRHYCYDPDDIWFLEVEVLRPDHFTDRGVLLAHS